jgi:hypothetical protein
MKRHISTGTLSLSYCSLNCNIIRIYEKTDFYTQQKVFFRVVLKHSFAIQNFLQYCLQSINIDRKSTHPIRPPSRCGNHWEPTGTNKPNLRWQSGKQDTSQCNQLINLEFNGCHLHRILGAYQNINNVNSFFHRSTKIKHLIAFRV